MSQAATLSLAGLTKQRKNTETADFDHILQFLPPNTH